MRIGAKMNNDGKESPNYIEESDDDEDSTTRSSSPEYTPYCVQPEWADVEPISIRTQTSIMEIKYTARYEDAFSYFRAMLVKDELSERSFALTADCIELQPSNFSVWYFRRRILRKLIHHLKNELFYVEKVIENEPKNYQVWHHRKTIVEWLRDASHDKHLTASVLSIDNKNYHAWQHRQWVIKEFGLWDGELEFTDAQLAMDLRNNSAWNHRFYIVNQTRRHEDTQWVEEELKHVYKRIEQLPTNESSWSYLRGLLNTTFNCLSLHGRSRQFCERLQRDKDCRSPHLLAFKLDLIHEELVKSPASNSRDRMMLKTQANELCCTLSEIDKIRSRYWNYIAAKIKEL